MKNHDLLLFQVSKGDLDNSTPVQKIKEFVNYLYLIHNFNFYFSGRGRVSTSSDPERPDTDEDSQMSYSNTSSPNPHSQGSYVIIYYNYQIITT